MLCIGGPHHGQNVECERDTFDAVVPRPMSARLFEDHPLDLFEPLQKVTYETLTIVTRSGQRIPVFVVE